MYFSGKYIAQESEIVTHSNHTFIIISKVILIKAKPCRTRSMKLPWFFTGVMILGVWLRQSNESGIGKSKSLCCTYLHAKKRISKRKVTIWILPRTDWEPTNQIHTDSQKHAIDSIHLRQNGATQEKILKPKFQRDHTSVEWAGQCPKNQASAAWKHEN